MLNAVPLQGFTEFVLSVEFKCYIPSERTPAEPDVLAKKLRHGTALPVLRKASDDVGPKVPAHRAKILEPGLMAFETFEAVGLRHDLLDLSLLICCQFHMLFL